MIQIYNYDDWKVYDGLASGSGRSEKIWLESSDGEIGVFKFPKVDERGNVASTEYVSEHIASRMGNILNIPVANVAIGYRGGRIGCMSYRIGSFIEEGVNYITKKYPSFNSNTLYAEDEDMFYCIEMVANSVAGTLDEGWFVPMLLFDFLIGNSDRHQSNWAILITDDGEYRLCPLYDNGSSLCSYIQENDIEKFMGGDELRFDALVKSKSRSCIRVDGRSKKQPRHEEVLRFLLANYPLARHKAEAYIRKLNRETVRFIVDEYPVEVLSAKKRVLIERFLNAKRDYMLEILKEA